METGTHSLHQQDGKHYMKPLQHLIAGFENYEPATEKKLACHLDLPALAVKWAYGEKADQSHRIMGFWCSSCSITCYMWVSTPPGQDGRKRLAHFEPKM